MSSKVWFITGTSKGFGHIWAEAALERGDKVVATARNKDDLNGLSDKYGDSVLTFALDVTNKVAVDAAVKNGHDRFGRLDVVVNNAGYGQFGAVEEVSESEARAQMDTNLFGALWVTQAALPFLRAQGSGHIIQVSSIGGINAFTNVGMYNASKWALEGLSQALSLEVREMGIHVTLVEPVGYSTDWSGPSAKRSQELPAYDGVRATMAARRGNMKAGNPQATAPVMLKLVDMDEPPLRLFFGEWANGMVHQEYAKRLAEWDKYQDLSAEAQGE